MDVVKYFAENNIDPNNQQLFFSKLIKSFMLDLKRLIKIRGIEVPHMILNTGDDTMWVLEKEYNYSLERATGEVSNEQFVYNIVPRCIVTPQGLDLMPEQLTNPYTRGNFQMEIDNKLYTLNGEYRRVPFKMAFGMKYVLDSFTDSLEMFQHIISKLSFIRTFKFIYMGQTMIASYQIPNQWKGEYQTEISSANNTDSRNRIIDIDVEVESMFPVFSERTITDIKLIAKPKVTGNIFINDTIIN